RGAVTHTASAFAADPHPNPLPIPEEEWEEGICRVVPMRFPALVEEWKQRAAERALTFLEEGMLVGLGTGSTAAKFVDLLGQRVKEGFEVTCVATSEGTRAQAERLGIALTTLDDVPFLDLTVDGADELDSDLRLIKG